MITGTLSSNIDLELYSADDKFICDMLADERMLGSYPIDDMCRIHVKSKKGAVATTNYEDISKVEKYVMNDDDYNKRSDSVRAFKERAKLLQNKGDNAEELEEKNKLEQLEIKTLLAINIGDRCEVNLPNQLPKRGEVMFKGETEFQKGKWIGVKYDEPLGKNDGSVKGKRYFDCASKFGGFVKYSQILCGNYPEKNLVEELEM